MDSDNDECVFIRYERPPPRQSKNNLKKHQVTLDGFLVKLEPKSLTNNALAEKRQQSEPPKKQQDPVRPNGQEVEALIEVEDEESLAVIIDEDPPPAEQTEIREAVDPPTLSDSSAELPSISTGLSELTQVAGTASSFASNFDDPMDSGYANDRQAHHTVVAHNEQPGDEADQVYIVDSVDDGDSEEESIIHQVIGLTGEPAPDESGHPSNLAPDTRSEVDRCAGGRAAASESEPNGDAGEEIQQPSNAKNQASSLMDSGNEDSMITGYSYAKVSKSSSVEHPRCPPAPLPQEVTFEELIQELLSAPVKHELLPLANLSPCESSAMLEPEQSNEQHDPEPPNSSNERERAARNEGEVEESEVEIVDLDPPPAGHTGASDANADAALSSAIARPSEPSRVLTSNSDDPLRTGESRERPSGSDEDQGFFAAYPDDGESNEPAGIQQRNGRSLERTPDEFGQAPDLAIDLISEGDTDAICPNAANESEPIEGANRDSQHPPNTQPIIFRELAQIMRSFVAGNNEIKKLLTLMPNMDRRVSALEQGSQQCIAALAELAHLVREQQQHIVEEARSQHETVPESRSRASASGPRSSFAQARSPRNGSPHEQEDPFDSELCSEAASVAPNFRSGFNQGRQPFRQQSAPRRRERKQRQGAGRLRLTRDRAPKAPRQKPCRWPGQIKDLLYQTLCKKVPLCNERIAQHWTKIWKKWSSIQSDYKPTFKFKYTERQTRRKVNELHRNRSSQFDPVGNTDESGDSEDNADVMRDNFEDVEVSTEVNDLEEMGNEVSEERTNQNEVESSSSLENIRSSKIGCKSVVNTHSTASTAAFRKAQFGTHISRATSIGLRSKQKRHIKWTKNYQLPRARLAQPPGPIISRKIALGLRVQSELNESLDESEEE